MTRVPVPVAAVVTAGTTCDPLRTAFAVDGGKGSKKVGAVPVKWQAGMMTATSSIAPILRAARNVMDGSLQRTPVPWNQHTRAGRDPTYGTIEAGRIPGRSWGHAFFRAATSAYSFKF